MERVDLLVRLQVWRARQVAVTDEHFQGLCVTEEEVDDLLRRSVGLPTWATAPAEPEATRIWERADALAEEHRQRAERSAREGVRLRLRDLVERFGLTRLDTDALLIALAPELDARYERLYAYLQDDVAKRRPSVDLLGNLLAASVESKIAVRLRLSKSGPLRAHGLLVGHDDPHDPARTELSRSVSPDERVTAYLLGSDEPPAALAGSLGWVEPAGWADESPLDDQTAGRLERWLGSDRADGAGPFAYLRGPPGAGRLMAAAAVCRRLGLPLLRVDGDRLRATAGPEFAAAVRAAVREAMLYDAALYWDGLDGLLADDAAGRLGVVLEGAAARARPTFLAGAAHWEPSGAHRDLRLVRVHVEPPDASARERLWGRALAEQALADDADLSRIAGAFRLGPGQVVDAAATAARLARLRGGDREPLRDADLSEACRRHSDHRLAALARPVPTARGWDDLVLPDESLEQLRDLCARVRHTARVGDDWGFRRKAGLRDGLTALFAGPPGTGKTMAAEVVAAELGFELYAVDLSTVVSKYIGETEKNLSQVFDAAERSNALLFFDEADALFGKRSEVRDARDRFANIEVSYLLQRMEHHQGVTVLATNMRNNIDAAFLRRLAFVIAFPFPDERTRLRIWEGVWPPDAPRAPDVDLAALARDHQLSGGSIRNVVVAAAFLAADEGAPIGMDHLLRATRREQRNLGKSTGTNAVRPHREAGGNGSDQPLESGRRR